MEDLHSLAITWIAVFIAHYCADKTRLTPVLWFLAMGCLLVNLGILPREPGIFMRDFAEIGIIVIMFALGFEENSSDFIRSIKRSWGIALFGALMCALVPLASGGSMISVVGLGLIVAKAVAFFLLVTLMALWAMRSGSTPL